MLEQIYALPSSQSEPTGDDRDGELNACQGGPDMGRHVVIAFVGMPISPRLFWRDAFKEGLEIGANGLRGILLNEQSSGRMPAEQREEPSLHLMGPQPIENMLCDFDETSPRGRDPKDVGELTHVADVRCPFRNDCAFGNTRVIVSVVGAPALRGSAWQGRTCVFSSLLFL
jgi:hypothetical protein